MGQVANSMSPVSLHVLPLEIWSEVVSFLWYQDCVCGLTTSTEWRKLITSTTYNLRLRIPLIPCRDAVRSLFRSLPRLRLLSVVRSSVRDIPEEEWLSSVACIGHSWVEAPRLQVLDLSRAWLSWKSTGELLSHLRALPALREMYLQGCEVSQTAVEYLMETEVSAETPGSPFVQFSRQCEGLCVQVPDVHGRD